MNLLVVVSNDDRRESVRHALDGHSDFVECSSAHEALDWLKTAGKGVNLCDRIICDELTYDGYKSYWVVMAAMSAALHAPVTLITSDDEVRRQAGAFRITSFIDIQENMKEALQRELFSPSVSHEMERL